MTGEIIIYSDGGSIHNPGPGAYGVLLETKTKGHVTSKELLQGYRTTTNNRMELLGVIKGLEEINEPKQEVKVYTDSRYVVDAIKKKWVFQWKKKQFKNRKNADLWQRLLKVYQKHQVEFHWVKGHHGNHRNERCDQLVALAIRMPRLLTDHGYEKKDGGKLF